MVTPALLVTLVLRVTLVLLERREKMVSPALLVTLVLRVTLVLLERRETMVTRVTLALPVPAATREQLVSDSTTSCCRTSFKSACIAQVFVCLSA
jgi:hypothetical protein